ncbi:hypothetical protein E2C01_085130 [Portunus trituberculatus]|uniref:Uncharacterized protein n=1 Tax=Portunus trituberculatus TaxID=210409 RepID=A0A5B7J9L9_PORTR|nr:hypothetical protein [Portunus trituberculatus]
MALDIEGAFDRETPAFTAQLNTNLRRIIAWGNMWQRRDVEGLTVMFKVQVKRVSYLQPLRQSQRRPLVATRIVAQTPSELLQPRCRTWH